MAQKFVGITLPIRMGQTGMFEQSTTLLTQTKSNFQNLILTKKGERLSQPDLGCDLWKILFEPLTEDTVEQARLSVIDAVDKWLPYLEVTDFTITPTPDANVLNISCRYVFRNNPNVTDTVEISASETGELSRNLNAENLGFTTRTGQEFTTTTGQIRRRRGFFPYVAELADVSKEPITTIP
jgi:phage baseplate assembly protein W